MGCVESFQRGEPVVSNLTGERPKELLDLYTLGPVLGQGGFGVVYAIRDKKTKKEFAVKMIDPVEMDAEHIQMEINVMRELSTHSCNCIIALHEVYKERFFVCLVMDICKGGDLSNGIKEHWLERGVIPLQVVQNITKMMAQSGEWLHRRDIVHRDLKSNNYLMDRKAIEDPQCRIFLCDFGTATRMPPDNEQLTEKAGTKIFWAPECYRCRYGKPVDVWAVGVIMYNLIWNSFPFKNAEETRNKRLTKIGTRLTDDGSAFLLSMLERIEARRFTFYEALDHPFLSSIKSAAQTAEEHGKAYPVYFRAANKYGLSARGCGEGDALADTADRDLWLRIRHDADAGVCAFESVKQPGFFLSAKQAIGQSSPAGQMVSLQKADGESEFFWEIEPMNGDSAFVSLESVALPRHVVTHYGGKIYCHDPQNAAQTNASVFNTDSSWRAEVAIDSHTDVSAVLQEKVSGAVQARRLELVKRLENAHDGVNQIVLRTAGDLLMPHFFIENQLSQKTSRFEWWTEEEVQAAGIYSSFHQKQMWAGATAGTHAFQRPDHAVQSQHTDASAKEILSILRRNADITLFGQNGAKTIKDFINEIKVGQCELMIDATAHKTMMRVVDIVLLRIVHGAAQAKQYLVRTTETHPDGRVRTNINQLIGIKKLPFENGLQAAERLLRDRLYISDFCVAVDPNSREFFEEEAKLPAYPGIMTMYRKEIYEATVGSSDPDVLNRLGISTRQRQYMHMDEKGNLLTYSWLKAPDCKRLHIQLRAPENKGDISSLHFALVGYSEEELHQFMSANNVDVSSFGTVGHGRLDEFADELNMGYSQLVKRSDGTLRRVVDVCAMRLTNADGRTLVEVSETTRHGEQDLGRLPAVKRRPDHNLFRAAKCVLSKALHANENVVDLDPESVTFVEEEKLSIAFPFLPTIYRKCMICASVIEDGTHSINI